MKSLIGFLLVMSYVGGWVSAQYGFAYDKLLLAMAFLVSGLLMAVFRDELQMALKLWEWAGRQVRGERDE